MDKYTENINHFLSLNESDRAKFIQEKISELRKRKFPVEYKCETRREKNFYVDDIRHDEIIEQAINSVIKTGDFGSFKFGQ